MILNSTHNKKELVRNLCSSIDLPHTTMVGPSNTVHEEADVIIVACVNRAINEGKKHILVVSDDTDVFLLLLHYKWIWAQYILLKMLRPCDGKVIDIANTALRLGPKSRDLLSLHALTGCDTVSYPYRGKATALKVFLSHDDQSLNVIGERDTSEEELIIVKHPSSHSSMGIPR